MSLTSIANKLLDFIFPSSCVSCSTRGPELCISCISSARGAERECEAWIFPMFDYRHPPIKKAVHLLKYKGKKHLARIFGEVIYGRMIEELSDLKLMENFENPILIPIPLSNARKRERGFNQAHLICIALMEIDQDANNFTHLDDVLRKPKDTIHQAHIHNRSLRLKNLIGSFEVTQSYRIKGRNIILIDDVTTTGATLSEARKTLRRAGARKVVAFAIAH